MLAVGTVADVFQPPAPKFLFEHGDELLPKRGPATLTVLALLRMKLSKFDHRRFPCVRFSHKDAEAVPIAISDFLNPARQCTRGVPSFKKQLVKLNTQLPTGRCQVEQFHIVFSHNRVSERLNKAFYFVLKRTQRFGIGLMCHSNPGVHYNRARRVARANPNRPERNMTDSHQTGHLYPCIAGCIPYAQLTYPASA